MQKGREILLYGGHGASFMDLWQLSRSLRGEVDLVRHPIRKVEGSLDQAALVISSSSLPEEECRRIRSYVERGGSYLGLGRGATAFFPGKSLPVLGVAAPIRFGKETFPVVIDGGCTFVGKVGEVLASYPDLVGTPPAIISCSFGKGRAILSGAHVDYSARLMEKLLSPDEARLGTKLVAFEAERRKLFRSLLAELGLTLVDKRQHLF